ncbi:MAG: hypothetical protein A6F72_03680 [Cycloclasticus sp. symbiont of Poecilosclerida sp. N]|nr:MAG: hypothetical protein A6F72_03680 [Cycloclasticus sp. symbiont of Poecilosclerida sp. N]
MTVDAGTGRVTGLADGANIIRIVVTAEDGTTEQTYTLTLNRALSAPAIATSVSIVNAVVGTAIVPVTIDSTRGTVASGYAISPEISEIGLSFSTTTGTISGTPRAVADEVTYIITATNTAGTNTATVTITVTLPPLPAIATSVSIVNAVVGTAITDVTIDSTGGTVSSYTISPAIENGLRFSTMTGTISGIPTAVADEVPYTITANNAATDVPGTAPVTATVTITVTLPELPAIATSVSIVKAVVGTAIVPVTIDSTGGTVVSYTISPPISPPIGNGLSFDRTTGTISGTPTAVADEVPYIITATNAAGTDMATVAITVTTATVDGTQVLNAVLPQLLRATTKITVDNISNRIDQALDASASTDARLNLGGSSTLQELINNNARTALQDGLDIKQMLNNSSFLIPLNVAGDNNYGANNMTLWGSGDYLNLSDDASGVDWEGEIVGGSVGIDARLSRNLVAGAAVSYSEGDIDYKRDGANNDNNTLTNTLTSVHPYLGYDLSQGGRVWGTFGYGQGEVEISDKINTVETKSSRDTELYSLAFGGSGDLLSSNSWLNLSGTTTLRLKGEVSLSNIKVDKSDLTDAKALSIDAHRYRIALEGSHNHTLASGASISPSIELGILYDDGSGDETGGGVELAGSYRYSNPQGLEMELRAHGLLAHESNYKEWGLSGLVKYRANSSGQGLWLSLQPAWGDTPSNVADRIWQPLAITDYANDEDSNGSRGLQLNTELGYGLPGFFGRGLLTPYAGLNMTNDTQSYNIGARWAIDSRLNLDLIGEHKQTDDSIQLRIDLKF